MNNAAKLLTALSDNTRARVFAWVLLNDQTGTTIAACAKELDFDLQKAAKATARLIELGLIRREGDQLAVDLDVLSSAARDLDSTNPIVAKLAGYPTLSAFFEHGTLRTYPTHPAKEQELLRFLTTLFSPEQTYSEAEFNEILRRVHTDYATLRRRLVDFNYATRTPYGDYQIVRKDAAVEKESP